MAGLAAAAALFRSLADPARLAIVQHLAGGQARVVDLTAELAAAETVLAATGKAVAPCPAYGRDR